jgi:hypothetical protein
MVFDCFWLCRVFVSFGSEDPVELKRFQLILWYGLVPQYGSPLLSGDTVIGVGSPLLSGSGYRTRKKDIHRDTGTQRHRDTETQRHRGTETQKHRDTKTQRHRDTETHPLTDTHPTRTHSLPHTHNHTQTHAHTHAHTHTQARAYKQAQARAREGLNTTEWGWGGLTTFGLPMFDHWIAHV